ncbi:hypothetical protein Ptr902_00066 [Pyrenophora tritici-repentis]|nr:hypothetical protein Ptr902_00066 [Pyrenophora tritici-repentis]
MIAAASPLAEALLWPVAAYLREARSLIHVSFDNWTSTSGRYAFTGLCVHYLNGEGKLVNHLLGLPKLHGAHTGNNIALVAATILRLFGVNDTSVGYFVLNNVSNNDTAVESLAEEFNFTGKDRSAYENDAAHLDDEEKYIDKWRKYGPIGVLFDRDEAEAIGVTANIWQLIKPVKTRWNSYFDTFVRAAELHSPIDSYIKFKLKEHSAATALSRRRKNRELLPAAQPRLYVREGGLSGKDWATITEYIQLLEPFAEATRLLEGRGQHGRHGAI